MSTEQRLNRQTSRFPEMGAGVTSKGDGQAGLSAENLMAPAPTIAAGAPTAAREESRLHVAAAGAVQEIARIADRLASVEQSAIEVKFDLAGDARLTLHVALREGALHTTFRTDSAELREALRQAWATQPPESPTSSLHFAAPDFAAPGASADLTGGQPDSRRPAHDERSASTMTTAAGHRAVGPSSSTFSAGPAPAHLRPDTALHLHAFA